jgi:hypothetical protein
MTNKAFCRLVWSRVLFKDLRIGNPSLAGAASNNGANDGRGSLQIEFIDEGV